MATAAETAGTAAHGAADELEHVVSVFPPFDGTWFASQLLWLVLSFAVFYYLMANVALPRIAGILESRRDRIASDLDAAQRLKQESDEAIASYEAALAQARANAFTIAESAREEARVAAAARQAEIETELGEKLASAETQLAAIKAEALDQVGTIATDTAAAIVEKLTGLGAEAAELQSAVAASLEEGRDNAG